MTKLRAAHEIAADKPTSERAALLDSLDVAHINVMRYQKVLEPDYLNPMDKIRAIENMVREMETLSMIETELAQMPVN